MKQNNSGCFEELLGIVGVGVICIGFIVSVIVFFVGLIGGIFTGDWDLLAEWWDYTWKPWVFFLVLLSPVVLCCLYGWSEGKKYEKKYGKIHTSKVNVSNDLSSSPTKNINCKYDEGHPGENKITKTIVIDDGTISKRRITETKWLYIMRSGNITGIRGFQNNAELQKYIKPSQEKDRLDWD